jgi:hypothetical protein
MSVKIVNKIKVRLTAPSVAVIDRNELNSLSLAHTFTDQCLSLAHTFNVTCAFPLCIRVDHPISTNDIYPLDPIPQALGTIIRPNTFILPNSDATGKPSVAGAGGVGYDDMACGTGEFSAPSAVNVVGAVCVEAPSVVNVVSVLDHRSRIMRCLACADLLPSHCALGSHPPLTYPLDPIHLLTYPLDPTPRQGLRWYLRVRVSRLY